MTLDVSTDQLPEYGVMRAYLTATAVEFDQNGDYSEEHGWIDQSWSWRVLFDSRNDVAPVSEYDLRAEHEWPDAESPADWMREILADTFGTVGYENNGDGTFYGSDEIVTDHTDPRSYTYALHFHVKHNDPRRGWVEDDVIIPDGLRH